MHGTYAIIATVALFISSPRVAYASLAPTHDYREVHSYPASTEFNPRDGWKRVTISDLPYKYPNQTASVAEQTAGVNAHRRDRRFGRVFDRRASKATKAKAKAKSTVKASNKSTAESSSGATGLLDTALKGIGQATSVVITW